MRGFGREVGRIGFQGLLLFDCWQDECVVWIGLEIRTSWKLRESVLLGTLFPYRASYYVIENFKSTGFTMTDWRRGL